MTIDRHRSRLRRSAAARRDRGRRSFRRTERSARSRLRWFRQATLLAVAITGLLLLLAAPEETSAQPTATAVTTGRSSTTVESVQGATETAPSRAKDVLPSATTEAQRTVRSLWVGFLGNLPRILVAFAALLVAWILGRILRPLLRRMLGHWERADAFTAMTGICLWILAFGIALSVVVGDIRALVGSLGFVGLALSWALQSPIESFTGWVMNSFRGYYRVGDRVAVGDIFGDIYRIDYLNTTVWEIGTPSRHEFVHAEQPTGRLITFPNSEVLTGSVINLTRDFAWVWDELEITIGSRSDLRYAIEVIHRTTTALLGDHMRGPAEEYERLLQEARLESSIPKEPQVFVSIGESGSILTTRYLVGARERRKWKSELSAALIEELNRPEHAERILSTYPRRQIQFIDAEERPVTPAGTG